MDQPQKPKIERLRTYLIFCITKDKYQLVDNFIVKAKSKEEAIKKIDLFHFVIANLMEL